MEEPTRNVYRLLVTPTRQARIDAQQVGEDGERAVAERLQGEGWVVVHTNFRDGPREIDLVVRRGKVVAFVEVKSRRVAGQETLHSIGWKKRQNLARAARAWIGGFGRPGELYRFDVAAVVSHREGVPDIDLIEDAWRVGD